jgi:hypothetical protein
MRPVRLAQKCSGFGFGRAYAEAAPYAEARDGMSGKKIMQSFLALFIAALLALAPAAPLWADDGGDDGGFDGGDFDDGGDEGEDEEDNDQDNDQDKDGDGRPDKDGHGGHGGHGHGHHGGRHHHHHSYGGWPAWGFGPAFGFGAFGYMPPYYPPAYYGYPPAAGRFVPPPVYIERKDVAQPANQAQGNFWHYCRSAEGYYPQVKECPDGWEQVAPQAKEDNQE